MDPSAQQTPQVIPHAHTQRISTYLHTDLISNVWDMGDYLLIDR